MSSNQYTRERKEDKPVLAICYDFDKTLSPDDMQAQGYIQSVGYDVGEFWTESNGLASQNDMDQNLAYMLLMKKKAAGKLVFTRENLENYGAKVSLFPGVEDWFERIRTYGAEHGVDDSVPPALISQIKYLRFNDDEYTSALSTLLRSLRKQFSK